MSIYDKAVAGERPFSPELCLLLTGLLRTLFSGESGEELAGITQEQAEEALDLARTQAVDAMAAEALLALKESPDEMKKRLGRKMHSAKDESSKFFAYPRCHLGSQP